MSVTATAAYLLGHPTPLGSQDQRVDQQRADGQPAEGVGHHRQGGDLHLKAPDLIDLEQQIDTWIERFGYRPGFFN